MESKKCRQLLPFSKWFRVGVHSNDDIKKQSKKWYDSNLNDQNHSIPLNQQKATKKVESKYSSAFAIFFASDAINEVRFKSANLWLDNCNIEDVYCARESNEE